MKTKVYPVLFAAALSLSACTEVLEPNVDYGGNTYINDYSSLVEAVNNLNKTFSERFDALNQLLQSGMADIKLAIDENTGAIKVVEQNTQQGLKDINTTLFDGFKTLSDQVDAQGKSIVYAMNTNGEILRLEIEESGKLISSQIMTSTDALVKVINDQTKSLEERFAALDASIQAGLKNVTLSIDENTKAITLLDENTQGSLTKIDGTLTDGFKATNQTLTDQGTKIVGAINDNGELLVAEIKTNGEVISAQIKGSVEDLISTMKDQNKLLTDKIEALNSTVETGLANVKASVDDATKQLTLEVKAVNNLNTSVSGQLGNLKTALDDVTKEVKAGFVAINSTMGDNNTKIIKAINTNGDNLEVVIKENGTVISAAIEAYTTSTNTQIGNLLTAVNSMQKTLNELNEKTGELSTAEKANAENIKTVLAGLNELLKNNGVYKVKDHLYMTEAAWKSVSADKDSEAYKSAQKSARNVTPVVTFSGTNYTRSNPNYTEGDGDLHAVNLTASSIGVEVYEIVTLTYTSAKVTISGNTYLLGWTKSYWKVGYDFTDAVGDKSQAASDKTATAEVTFISGNKMVESVAITVSSKKPW